MPWLDNVVENTMGIRENSLKEMVEKFKAAHCGTFGNIYIYIYTQTFIRKNCKPFIILIFNNILIL
jgi:hypothetical protein